MNRRDLDDVEEVVFLKNPLNYPWVRQSVHISTRRKGKIPVNGLIGYENVKKRNEKGIKNYRRRYWYRMNDDVKYKDERKPIEAIEPSNIEISDETKVVNLYRK